ncbi:MAG: flippase [Muribaculaceae bacterium]|nr:flippase [Muribaculaceae bacterium]MDE5928986.1 flippase [Muribaculaceae bacterium]
MRSLGRNYALNAVNTVGGVVFYLITFPYSARVLGPEAIGQVNFYQSIITYISLISCLGIPLYGVREIARLAHKPAERSRTAVELLLLHLQLTAAAAVVIGLLCVAVPQIRADIPLFLVLSSSLLFAAIGCEWFFSGTEDFAYITVRGLCVRVAYAIVLFSCVHSPQDLLLYGALTVFGTYGSHVFNLMRFRRLSASPEPLRGLQPWRHSRAVARVFGMTVASAIYINLNVVILGFISGDTAVGYFMGAMKIVTVPLGLLTALQTTLLPRTSALLATDRPDEYRAVLRKSMRFVWALGLPMGTGLALLAEPIVLLFCGEAYLPAAGVLRILGPALVLIAFVCVLNAAVFIPLAYEKAATAACLGGAAVSLAVNLLLIPSMSQNGAAWASLAAEGTVAAIMAWHMRRRLHTGIIDRDTPFYLLATAVMTAAVLLVRPYAGGIVAQLVLLPLTGAAAYGATLAASRRWPMRQ